MVAQFGEALAPRPGRNEDRGIACAIAVAVDFGYGDPNASPTAEQTYQAFGRGGFWDTDQWDTFLWSSPIADTIEFDLDGASPNCAPCLISDHTYEEPHTLSAVTLWYSPRRAQR